MLPNRFLQSDNRHGHLSTENSTTNSSTYNWQALNQNYYYPGYTFPNDGLGQQEYTEPPLFHPSPGFQAGPSSTSIPPYQPPYRANQAVRNPLSFNSQLEVGSTPGREGATPQVGIPQLALGTSVQRQAVDETQAVDQAPGRVECEYCYSKFVSKKGEMYKSHLKNWHRIEKTDRKQVMCNECFIIRQDKLAVLRCKKGHKNDPNWKTPEQFICNNGECVNVDYGVKKKAFLQHLNRHHHIYCYTDKEPEKYNCQFCEMVLSSLKGVGQHEKSCKDNPSCPPKNRTKGRKRGAKKKPTQPNPATNRQVDDPPANPQVDNLPANPQADNTPANILANPQADNTPANILANPQADNTPVTLPPMEDNLETMGPPGEGPPPNIDGGPAAAGMEPAPTLALEDAVQSMESGGVDVGRLALVASGLIDRVDSGEGSLHASQTSVHSFDSENGMVYSQRGTSYCNQELDNAFDFHF